jgi:hypothetical protein
VVPLQELRHDHAKLPCVVLDSRVKEARVLHRRGESVLNPRKLLGEDRRLVHHESGVEVPCVRQVGCVVPCGGDDDE